MRMNPYLVFSGQCEAAFKFYQECLGGKIEALFPFGETPSAEHVPPGWQKKIMHGAGCRHHKIGFTTDRTWHYLHDG